MATRCKATKKGGEPCAAFAQGDNGFCFAHDPARAADRARARKLGGLRTKAAHNGDPEGVPAKVRTLQDVLEILDYTLAELLGLDNSLARGRALIALAGQYTDTIRESELEQRIDALEAILRARS